MVRYLVLLTFRELKGKSATPWWCYHSLQGDHVIIFYAENIGSVRPDKQKI